MSWRSTGALAYHTRRCVGEARVSATKGVDVPATPKVSVTKDGLVDSATPTVVVPVRRVAQVDHTKEKISNVSVTEPADGAEEDRPAIVDAGSGGGAVEVPASGGQEEVDGAAIAIDVPGQPEEQQQPSQRMTWMVG